MYNDDEILEFTTPSGAKVQAPLSRIEQIALNCNRTKYSLRIKFDTSYNESVEVTADLCWPEVMRLLGVYHDYRDY